MRRAEVMVGYLRSSGRVAEPFGTPPGYFSVKDAVRMIKARGKRTTTTRDGKAVDTHHGAIEDLVKAGIMFVGTPDDVYGQLSEFIDNIGGLGHFLMMGHAGHMTHEEAVDQITLVAREVLPRLQKPRAASSRRHDFFPLLSKEGWRAAPGWSRCFSRCRRSLNIPRSRSGSSSLFRPAGSPISPRGRSRLV